MSQKPENPDPKEVEAYEQRVKSRVKLLIEDFRSGNMSIADGLAGDFQDKLNRIKFDEDGEPIVDTVDGSIRAAAMASQFRHESVAASKISPAWIQTELFSLIEDIVRPILSIPGADDFDAHSISINLMEDETFVKGHLDLVARAREAIAAFWDDYEWILKHHYFQHKHSRALFVGDVFPADPTSTCCRTGLFFDQVLLPDPISRVTFDVAPGCGDEVGLQQLIKHCVSAYRIKELLFADVDVPPVALVPGTLSFDEEDAESNWVKKITLEDALLHLSRGFGREFEDPEAWLQFSSGKSIEWLVENASQADRLMTTNDGIPDLGKAIHDYIEYFNPLANRMSRKLLPHEAVMAMACGRMGQANDALTRAQGLHAQPVYDVKASYQWLNWKLDLDSERGFTGESKDWKSTASHKLAASTSTPVDFLDGLTAHGLIAARSDGMLDELRKSINQTIELLQDPENVDDERQATEAVRFLHDAVAKYNTQAKSIKERLQKNHKGLTWTLATGTIATCAAFASNPYLIIGAGLAGSLGGDPGLLATWKGYKEALKAKKELRATPMGVLLSK